MQLFVCFVYPSLVLARQKAEEGNSEKEKFDETVRAASYFTQEEELLSPELLQENVEAETTRTVMETHGGNEVQASYNCRVHQYRAAPGHNELFLLNPRHDIIYPGSVIDGASVEDGRYVPINAERKPLKISVSILGINETSSSLAEKVSLSGVRQALQPLLSQSNTEGLEPAANSVFSVRELHNEMHFGLAVGVNIKAQVTPRFRTELGDSFSFDTEEEKHHYTARYAHRYFTVDVELPSNPSDLYETVPQINDPRVSPVYVSSVTYGRMILFSLKTNRSGTELSAALNASLEVADNVDVSAELSVNHREALESSEIGSTLIGGSGNVCNGVDSIESLGTCISESGLSYQDAVPIAYTMRFLKDNSIARIVLSNTYNVRECSLTSIDSSATDRFSIESFRSSNNDDGNQALDIYGSIGISATNETPGNKGECTSEQVNDHKSIFDFSAGYEFLSNFIPDREIVVGGNWQNVASQNYQGSIMLDGTRPNISVCGRLWDNDFDSNDDMVNTRHVFTADDFDSLGSGQNPKVIRFGSENWLEIELRQE